MENSKSIKIITDISKETFLSEIYPQRKPVILRGVDIGQCKEKWTEDYLAENGGSTEVKIHVSETHQMDFIHKNFLYRSLPFNELIKRASEEKHTEYFIDEHEKYYLRALGTGNPRKDIADIRIDFPNLAKDIIIPELFESSQLFSSVLRVASKSMQLWTHYDIMDNILIQITGMKKVVLFSPSDVQYLYLNGDKSEVLNIDNPDLDRFPDFIKATRYQCILQPGDILFIPALWFHNVISLEFGVAVNVFWKHLNDKLYDSKDTYGNKDLLPAQRATQILDRAIKTLDELPMEYKEFYAKRLIARVESKVLSTSAHIT